MSFVADFPGAIVVEAATYGYTFGNFPKMWFLHTPEEKPDDYPGTPYYFHNLTGRQASTHYFVSYLGFVFQMVPEREGAYANAREGKPGVLPGETPGWNLNLESLNVEIEGYAASIHLTMPRGSPQWVSLVRLLAHRCAARGIPPERMFGHYAVSVNRSDPGRLDIGAIIEDVKRVMAWDADIEEAVMNAEQERLLQAAIFYLETINARTKNQEPHVVAADPRGPAFQDAVRAVLREELGKLPAGERPRDIEGLAAAVADHVFGRQWSMLDRELGKGGGGDGG